MKGVVNLVQIIEQLLKLFCSVFYWPAEKGGPPRVELQKSRRDMRLAPDEAKLGSIFLLYLRVHGPGPRSDDDAYVVRISEIARKVWDLVLELCDNTLL